MPVSHSLREQLVKLDQQIVDLLAERVNLCQKALEEDEGVFDDATQAEFVTEWEGMADEQGLHVPSVSGICRLVMKMCRVSGE
jgi:chorismate mutase